MKKLVFVAAAILSFAAQGQEVELKGIRIGMTQEEFNAVYPTTDSLSNFTLAGVSGLLQRPVIKFVDGKLDSFFFMFSSDGYEDVSSAIKAKYPNLLKCRTSTIQNGMGATFQQEECISESLSMTRYVSDVKTSVVSMLSKRAMTELVEKRKAKKNDL